MESKLPLGPVRSRTWHSTSAEKVISPATKRPATTLGITHSPVATSSVIRKPLTRPKTTTGRSASNKLSESPRFFSQNESNCEMFIMIIGSTFSVTEN